MNQNLFFCEIDNLTDYDMILGERSLRRMKAQINFFEYKLTYTVPTDEPIQELQKINFINDSLDRGN